MRSVKVYPASNMSKSEAIVETETAKAELKLPIAQQLLEKFNYFYNSILTLIKTTDPDAPTIAKYAVFFLYIALEIAKPNLNAIVAASDENSKGFLTNDYFEEMLKQIQLKQTTPVNLHDMASVLFDPFHVLPIEKTDKVLLQFLKDDINKKKTLVSSQSSHQIQRLNYFFNTLDVQVNTIYYESKREYLQQTKKKQKELNQDQVPVVKLGTR